MKNKMLARVNKRPFELVGFTLDEYVAWCNKHSLPVYKTSTKKLFFKKIDDYSLVKRNGTILEDGEAM